MLIGGLFVAGIMWGDYATEAYPEDIFTRLFQQKPSSQITQLRAYSDDDELHPVFLQFQAPPPLAQALLKSKFRPTSSGFAVFALDDAKSVSKPDWFDDTIAPDAQVYQLAGEPSNTSHIAIYDARLNRVRVYLDNPWPLSRR